MIFLIGLLTVVLVVNCILLILLVLIQLPKKEAGAGLAFGGAATDALFGAGSGNVLTKTTKYATVSFFVLLLLIGIMQNSVFRPSSKAFNQAVDAAAREAAGSTLGPTTPTAPATMTNLQSAILTNTGTATPVPTNSTR
jgi:preprotein translocase subunit SecG